MKYMGSKNRLSKELVPIIQSYVDKGCKGYLEPFVGGANMIDKIKCDKKYGSDNHKYLIALLENVHRLNELDKETITKKHYSDVRDCYNKKLNTYEDWYIGAIGFLSSYNGRFFDGGYAGTVNIKNGKTRNYYKESLNNLIEQSPRLSDIKFKNLDYRKIGNIKGYVIYCDIPYKDTKQYSTSKNFNYEDFYDWCKKMKENGNVVLISEYYMPPDRFDCIWSKDTITTMDNSRIENDEKYKRTERLFVVR